MTIAEKILQRASELGIAIWVEGDKIKCRGYGAIPPKMVEVIRAHKPELIAYLQTLSALTLCATCLDQGIETPARFVGPEDLMYCQDHYRVLPEDMRKADMERMAEAYRKALPSWEVAVEPHGRLSEHLAQSQVRDQGPPKDYWAETRAKLKQTGYYEQVARNEERLRQHVPTPRVYPAPFPAYALLEVNGVKTMQVVGMWHESEDRLLTVTELPGQQTA